MITSLQHYFPAAKLIYYSTTLAAVGVCVSQQLRGGTGSGAGVAAECPRLGRPDPATSQQSSKGARTLLHFAARIYLK